MIRVFRIVEEFGAYAHVYQHMVNVVKDDFDKLVCVGNLVYCPLGGGRVFEVDNLIMPTVISVDIDKEVHVTRHLKEYFIKYRDDNYVAVDRKHSFVVYKLPGMKVPLLGYMDGIKVTQLLTTNFDKKVGY